MKSYRLFILPVLLLSILAVPVKGQESFSAEAYQEFRKAHRNYTASEIIADQSPATTYYANRKFPTDLSAVPWFDSLDQHLGFTAYEKELLARNHFMVTERLGHMDWPGAFTRLYSADLPLFLSTDFILSTLHNSYDAILQSVELQLLEPNLKVLLKAMYAYLPVLDTKYGDDPRMESALRDADLYISVARSLAEGKDFVPQLNGKEEYDQLMAAIASEQMTHMQLFTESKVRKLDFSQFTPRGHYNEEIYTPDGKVTLENYFRAMMWLGRIDFLMTAPPENPWEPDWTDEEIRRMQLGALLVNEALKNCGKEEVLLRHERIISFLVGPDDNLTPNELEGLSESLLTSPADLFEEGIYASFKAALNSSDDYGQKIMSNFFLVDPDSTDPGQLPVSFKLMGQKFLIDSYVFSEVVYDRIAHEGRKVFRPLPDPLDVMAALGNEDALALLEEEMERYHYAPNMAGLQYMIESYDEEFWSSSLYNTWLAALRSLNPPESADGLPYFMQSTAWHQQKLNTQLTSWAQLRHDNILYGKQSYTGGTGCSYPYTYVEPFPDFFALLGDFAVSSSAFYSDELSGLPLGDSIVAYYERYAWIMGNLENIAWMEVNGQALGENEIEFLKTMINEYMASGPSISGWYTKLFYKVEKALAMDFTVADVHTQPTDEAGNVVGNVLHVGNGRIDMGVFLAPNPCEPGRLMAFAGPVSAFHYEVKPGFERLTDQEWEAYYRQDQAPPRPDWVSSYLAGRDGMARDEGRTLKGVEYTGTGPVAPPVQEELSYMLLFPNPSTEGAALRFVLNRSADLDVQIYDTAGRLLYSDRMENLPAAEHHIALPVEAWQQGLYLVRTCVGGLIQTRELVLQ